MLVRLLVEVDMFSVFLYYGYVTLLRILINTEDKLYDKSVHTGEEPYIYDFITASLINKPCSQQ